MTVRLQWLAWFLGAHGVQLHGSKTHVRAFGGEQEQPIELSVWQGRERGMRTVRVVVRGAEVPFLYLGVWFNLWGVAEQQVTKLGGERVRCAHTSMAKAAHAAASWRDRSMSADGAAIIWGNGGGRR